MKNQIQLSGNTIIKYGNPATMHIEVEKSIRAFAIGRETGLFRVPRILDYDITQGKVVLEYISNIQGVRNAIRFNKKYGELFEKIGMALAMIHRKLALPPKMLVPLPEGLTSHGSEVFLHGDFTIDNICVSAENSSIVILDWQMTDIHGGKSTYGTRYFDLAWFINTLFSKPFYNYLFSPPTGDAARRFLTGYFNYCNIPFNTDEFYSYMEEFYRIKVNIRKRNLNWKGRLLLAPGHVYWRRFINSQSSNRLLKDKPITI